MCGLLGSIAFDKKIVSKERLKQAADTIAKRGPDDEGFWQEGNVSLAHRRLSILDVSSAGHQPMVSACGRYVIVFNGEIYNFADIRERIGSDFAAWKSHSDTETIIEAYRKWGEECLKHFHGMFAFAIWDKKEQKLFAARDRMGVKPFYYSHSGKSFTFGSRAKALLKLDDNISTNVDEQGLRLYLETGYVPAPYSIWKDIKKLPPAHYMNVFADGQVEFKRYWDFAENKIEPSWKNRSEESLLDELDEILSLSIKSRMVSDVPLGAFLSGGIDSSLVVALMQKYSSAPVKTFTIGFEEKENDESSHAEAVANHLGTEHYCQIMKVDDLLDFKDEFFDEYDEPFFDHSAFSVMAVSKLARQHVTVSLSGDGGDELFGGYRSYAQTHILAHVFWLPQPLRKLIFSVFKFLPKHRLRLLGQALQQKDYPALLNFFRSISKEFKGVIGDDIINSTLSMADIYRNRETAFAKKLSFAETGMRFDLTYLLADDFLQKIDVGSMAFSLEGRDPLLDQDIVDWATKLPLKWKIRGNTDKYLLKKLAYRYIDKEILDRPKKGFGVPMIPWLRGPLKSWMRDILHDSSYYENIPLKQDKVIELYNQHDKGADNVAHYLWSIVVLLESIKRAKQ